MCATVGHGSFGVVFQALIDGTDETVAIKKVLQDRRFKNRELEIMETLRHPNVVKLKYSFFTTDKNEEVRNEMRCGVLWLCCAE